MNAPVRQIKFAEELRTVLRMQGLPTTKSVAEQEDINEAAHDHFSRRREEMKRENDLKRALRLEEDKKKRAEERRYKAERAGKLERQRKLMIQEDRERQRRENLEQKERMAQILERRKEMEAERLMENKERLRGRVREAAARRLSNQNVIAYKKDSQLPTTASSQSEPIVSPPLTAKRPVPVPERSAKADYTILETDSLKVKEYKRKAQHCMDTDRPIPHHIIYQLGMPKRKAIYEKFYPDSTEEEELEENEPAAYLCQSMAEQRSLFPEFEPHLVRPGSSQPSSRPETSEQELLEREELIQCIGLHSSRGITDFCVKGPKHLNNVAEEYGVSLIWEGEELTEAVMPTPAKQLCRKPSHMMSFESLAEWLEEEDQEALLSVK